MKMLAVGRLQPRLLQSRRAITMVSLMETEYDGTGRTLIPEPDTTIDVRDGE